MQRFLLIAPFVFAGAAASAVGDEPLKSRSEVEEAQIEELSTEAHKVVTELKASLREGSEGRAMLDCILDGSTLGPGEGWFKLAVSQTRFPFETVKKSYDADQDGQVGPAEFPGSQDDFARLDRDQDRLLTEADFDWDQSSLTRTPGTEMFFRADQDANGKVTPEEFEALFRSMDSGEGGFLSLDDLREQFQLPTEEQLQKSRARRKDEPSKSTLVLALKGQEIGSLQPGPKLNEIAPDFRLKSVGGEEVTLSKEVGEKPIVLIFGNFTCGPFRSQSGNLEKLHERYKGRANSFWFTSAKPTPQMAGG